MWKFEQTSIFVGYFMMYKSIISTCSFPIMSVFSNPRNCPGSWYLCIFRARYWNLYNFNARSSYLCNFHARSWYLCNFRVRSWYLYNFHDRSWYLYNFHSRSWYVCNFHARSWYVCNFRARSWYLCIFDCSAFAMFLSQDTTTFIRIHSHNTWCWLLVKKLIFLSPLVT